MRILTTCSEVALCSKSIIAMFWDVSDDDIPLLPFFTRMPPLSTFREFLERTGSHLLPYRI